MSKAIGDATPTTNRKSGGVNQPATIKKQRQSARRPAKMVVGKPDVLVDAIHMTDIFKLTTTQPSRPGRASRILALDGLNAGFLVNTQHYRVSGRAAIQFANHIDLLAKGRIRTVQPLLDPVRANVACLQNTLHMAAADLPDNAAPHGAHHNLVERRRDPSLSFLRFTRQRDQLQPCFLRDARRTTTALAFPNTLHTLPRNALAPLADRLHRHAQFLRNHRIRVALMSQ